MNNILIRSQSDSILVSSFGYLAYNKTEVQACLSPTRVHQRAGVLAAQRILLKAIVSLALISSNSSIGCGSSLDSWTSYSAESASTIRSPQTFFLNFDGMENVVFNGPERIEKIHVPPFVPPACFAGSRELIKRVVVLKLREKCAKYRFRFTSKRPKDTEPYSTIFIGGVGREFFRWGKFLGIAEAVDENNENHSDKAFVFSERFADYCQSLDNYIWQLCEIISHEAMHLMGWRHGVESGRAQENAFLAVAFAQSDENPVHQWITQQAYLLFRSIFGQTELDKTFSTRTAWQWVQVGAQEEDESSDAYSLSSNQGYKPVVTHFWAHENDFSRKFNDGLFLHGSAVSRAQQYFTGGRAFTGTIENTSIGYNTVWAGGEGKGILIEECIEPQVYWDDWKDYRDGFRGCNDRKLLRSRFMPGAKYLNIERWNKKLRLLITRRAARKNKLPAYASIARLCDKFLEIQ